MSSTGRWWTLIGDDSFLINRDQKYRKRSSVLKNSFALFSASESGTENDFLVVFWPCFGPLLDYRSGRQRLFQHAGSFSIHCYHEGVFQHAVMSLQHQLRGT